VYKTVRDSAVGNSDSLRYSFFGVGTPVGVEDFSKPVQI